MNVRSGLALLILTENQCPAGCAKETQHGSANGGTLDHREAKEWKGGKKGRREKER